MSVFEPLLPTTPRAQGYCHALSPTVIVTALESAGTEAPDLRSRLEDTTRTADAAQAIELATVMQSRSAAYFRGHLEAAQRLRWLHGACMHDVTVDWLDAKWHPQYAHEVMSELVPAGLDHAASAHLEEHVDEACLCDDARQQISAVQGVGTRETLRDFYLNRKLRRDLYTRGAPRLSPWEREARQLIRRWTLVTPRWQVATRALPGACGITLLAAEECVALLDALAERPTSLRELLSDRVLAAMGHDRLRQALLLLSGTGHVQPALPEGLSRIAEPSVDRFNAILESYRSAGCSVPRVSSVTGQAIGRVGAAMALRWSMS